MRICVKLTQRVENFSRQLADLVAIETQGKEAALTFFRRLVNFDAWRIAGKPRADQFLDYQVVNSDIEAERDHLRVGDHTVRVLTMKEAIGETRPLVLDQLFKIPANFYVVTEWTPLSMAKARKEVMARRRHFNIAKSGFISQVRDEKTPQRDQLIDESKQADIEDLGDCLRTLGNGQSLGEFSLSIVLYDRDRAVLDRQIGEFAGVFTNADGALFTETYNQLNAFFAAVPGNYARNLRKLALLNSNYADLSFLFTILPGERWNHHLDAEYLAALETDNDTPYFLNLHNGEVAQTLILGMTGSGKTFFSNFLLMNAQKYRPYTYIFDVGNSYQSLTEIFGGTYLNVGQDSRDFTINPFSLEPTQENQQFLFSFFRVLIEGDDQRFRLDYREERNLWDAIERMYVVAPDQRTLSTFAEIIGELKGQASPLGEGWAVRLSLRQHRRHALLCPLPDIQLRWVGKDDRGAGATVVLRAPPRLQSDHCARCTRHIQDIPDGRGVAVFQESDDSQLHRRGREDLAQAQRRHDSGHAVHQGAAVFRPA